jgi:hypothetical protein
MTKTPLPEKARTFDIEGRSVRYIEVDGKRTWICECEAFKERATRHAEGFCVHTVVAIAQCIEDRSIEIK